MTNLPSTITAYLDQPAVDQFTADASVTDDGRTHRGPEEIRRWLDRAASEWVYTTERTGSTRIDEDHWTVTNHLAGNFPGGVADLVYRFTLRDGLITELVIAP